MEKIEEEERDKEDVEVFDYAKSEFDSLFSEITFYRFETYFDKLPSSLLGIVRKYAHNKLERIFLQRKYEDALNEHSKEIIERLKLLKEKEKEREREDEKQQVIWEKRAEEKRQRKKEYKKYLKEREQKTK